MWRDDELVMISALEHYSYCPRQCGLIHVESIYHENVFTLKGRAAHERAHDGPSGQEGPVRVERGLPVWCERLGLTGVGDVVEFHPDRRVYPVEYKRGARRGTGRQHEDLQLCAQALCLEEMLDVSIPAGAIYSHQTRRRREVPLDAPLRRDTEAAVAAVRAMLRDGRLPPPVNDARCPNCSLVDACVPAVSQQAARRVARAVWRIAEDES